MIGHLGSGIIYMYRYARLLNHVGRDYGEVLSIYVDTDLKKKTGLTERLPTLLFTWTNVSYFRLSRTFGRASRCLTCYNTFVALYLGHFPPLVSFSLKLLFKPSGTRAFQASKVVLPLTLAVVIAL